MLDNCIIYVSLKIFKNLQHSVTHRLMDMIITLLLRSSVIFRMKRRADREANPWEAQIQIHYSAQP